MRYPPPQVPPAEPKPPRTRNVLDAPPVRWWEWALLGVAFTALILLCVWLGTV